MGAVRALRVVGAGGAVRSEYGSMWALGAVGVLEERNACGSCWGSKRTLFSLLFCVSSEYGSMWAVGAAGVLEERNACGRGR